MDSPLLIVQIELRFKTLPTRHRCRWSWQASSDLLLRGDLAFVLVEAFSFAGARL